MEHRRLGRHGLLVPAYALGTMTFGAETPERDAHAVLDRYRDAGGSLLDLADVYADGESERIVGRWLAAGARRDEVLLATKARFGGGDDPNRRGLSAAWLHRALDESLQRLGVDHVDLFQVHAGDPLVPVEEWVGALQELVRTGRTRYVGASNLRGHELQHAALLARQQGGAPIVSLQPQYNLLAREIEWELVPVCLREGIGILPWSPLGGGWLTGKYRPEEPPEDATRLGEDPDRGVEAWEKRATRRTWRIVEAVREVAEARGATPSQVALSWVTARPGVSSTILGVRTLAQLEDNLGALDQRLGPEETARLEEVSRPETPEYPYGLLDRLDAERRSDAATS
jgi:aryl-alcohol dehydrogenase-like predicted oxidoreductase